MIVASTLLASRILPLTPSSPELSKAEKKECTEQEWVEWLTAQSAQPRRLDLQPGARSDPRLPPPQLWYLHNTLPVTLLPLYDEATSTVRWRLNYAQWVDMGAEVRSQNYRRSDFQALLPPSQTCNHTLSATPHLFLGGRTFTLLEGFWNTPQEYAAWRATRDAVCSSVPESLITQEMCRIQLRMVLSPFLKHIGVLELPITPTTPSPLPSLPVLEALLGHLETHAWVQGAHSAAETPHALLHRHAWLSWLLEKHPPKALPPASTDIVCGASLLTCAVWLLPFPSAQKKWTFLLEHLPQETLACWWNTPDSAGYTGAQHLVWALWANRPLSKSMSYHLPRHMKTVTSTVYHGFVCKALDALHARFPLSPSPLSHPDCNWSGLCLNLNTGLSWASPHGTGEERAAFMETCRARWLPDTCEEDVCFKEICCTSPRVGSVSRHWIARHVTFPLSIVPLLESGEIPLDTSSQYDQRYILPLKKKEKETSTVYDTDMSPPYLLSPYQLPVLSRAWHHYWKKALPPQEETVFSSSIKRSRL